MNAVGWGLVSAVVVALAATVAALAVPRRHRPAVTGVGVVAAGLLGTVAGVVAMTGTTWSVARPDLLPLIGLELDVDSLSGVFLAVGGVVAIAAGTYAIGAARHGLDGPGVQAALPAFVASLLLVPAAGSVGTLLYCWELMALTSLVLVVAEHRERPAVASAGLWYAVMTHAGFVAIMVGLLVAAGAAGDGSFAAIRAAASGLSPAAASPAFLACLAGFGSKAGMVPLHPWLPRAHPEAPSHVSALMSAAMVNLGVYGIVRVGVDLLGGGPSWWWVTVLVLGAVSAVYGILQAAVGSDLKRLLGYSTTENMGLVLVGVGACGMFAAAGSRALAGLALTAALLHVMTHAAFKTVLFLSAGSVLHATGTRDLDALGGLRSRMPVTTAAFGVGALAASALPPGAAFVSEWLLLQALIHGLPAPGVVPAVVLPLGVAAIALTAGLAVATFVKAFGIGFLGRPRGAGAAAAAESGPAALTAMVLAGLACVAAAVCPTLVLPTLAEVAGGVVHAAPAVTGTVAIELVGVSGVLSPVLLVVTLIAAAAAVVGALRLLARRRDRRRARLWDCGAGPLSARMEYTATSFAEPLQRVFDDVLAPEQDVDVSHHEESRYLVAAVSYRRELPDRVERRLYTPLLDAATAWGRAGRGLATGSVHRYLGYGFVTLCGLLAWLVVTR
ncbi:proton-conducting transporter transmembrane domain-containing protein [Pseudonocardia dioxanivorans]|uniref:proton-conducting transporter transmembrane domain-containing protein n=1 Tax=Pseudonocardia dioxanivorans TaxID=240495 RepID=UPI000CD18AE8|nr:proton-conducting transporter membrane subunit [Pseudonocardia dioxanivorans]